MKSVQSLFLALGLVLALAGCSTPSGTADLGVQDLRQADVSGQDLRLGDTPGDALWDTTQDLRDDGQDSVLPADVLTDGPLPVDVQDLTPADGLDLGPLEDQTPPEDQSDSNPADSLLPDTQAVPLPGLGTITGECGVLDETEIQSASPFVFVNVLDFGSTPFTGDLSVLSPGAQEVLTDGNAGGSSSLSETISFDVLYRCELAKLVKTENEVVYDVVGKMTDILVEIDGFKVGVSVTRGFNMSCETSYSLDLATALLNKKLKGIQESTAIVSPGDAWTKQILHVLTCGPAHAELLLQAWQTMLDNPETRTTVGDSILIITITEGSDSFIYDE